MQGGMTALETLDVGDCKQDAPVRHGSGEQDTPQFNLLHATL